MSRETFAVCESYGCDMACAGRCASGSVPSMCEWLKALQMGKMIDSEYKKVMDSDLE